MLRPAWAYDHRGHLRPREEPGKGERGHGDATLRSYRAQPLEAAPAALVLEPEVRLGALGHTRSGGIGLPASVLSGQPAARERAEGRKAEAVLGAELQHTVFRLAVEERIRVLHPLEARPSVPLG